MGAVGRLVATTTRKRRMFLEPRAMEPPMCCDGLCRLGLGCTRANLLGSGTWVGRNSSLKTGRPWCGARTAAPMAHVATYHLGTRIARRRCALVLTCISWIHCLTHRRTSGSTLGEPKVLMGGTVR